MSINFPGLNIELDYVPQAIRILGYEITIYGILISLGMILGIFFIEMESKRCQLNQNHVLGATLMGMIGAVIGGRIFYVIFSGTYYGNWKQLLEIRDGGMAFYGALFGGILFSWVYCCISRQNFMKVADVQILGVLLVQIFGRIGDFFSRGSFGEYTDHILAMQIPLDAVKASEVTKLMHENIILVDGVSYIQVQPLFLYEALWCLGTLFILMAVQRRKKYAGEIFMRYLAAYGFGRFFIEYFRTDSLEFLQMKISVSMVISGALFVIFFVVSTVKGIMASKRAARKRKRLEIEINE